MHFYFMPKDISDLDASSRYHSRPPDLWQDPGQLAPLTTMISLILAVLVAGIIGISTENGGFAGIVFAAIFLLPTTAAHGIALARKRSAVDLARRPGLNNETGIDLFLTALLEAQTAGVSESLLQQHLTTAQRAYETANSSWDKASEESRTTLCTAMDGLTKSVKHRHAEHLSVMAPHVELDRLLAMEVEELEELNASHEVELAAREALDFLGVDSLAPSLEKRAIS